MSHRSNQLNNNLCPQAREAAVRKKRTILAAEEEQERMQRQASQAKQQSHFRQFISSVTSRSQSVDISLRDLKSEVHCLSKMN